MTDWSQEVLNSEQLAAIEEPGSVVLVACPGSGKTRTLTYKVAEELAKLESERQFVVAITYTHRAAEEIEERVAQLGVDTQQLWIGTIHAFCLEWIIRPYAIYHPRLRDGYHVINSHEAEQIIADLCSSSLPRITHFDCGYHFTTSERVLQEPKAWKHAAINAVLDRYVVELENRQEVDFEHILLYASDLIQSRPEISKLLSRIFTFVAVDEYQDTREIQYAIVGSILRAGAGAVRALFVGDPNQAIFGSLGGYAIDPIKYSTQTGLTFRTMELSRNYRSSARIIDYFGHFKVAGSPIEAASSAADYPSEITFDDSLKRSDLEDEIVRLIRHSVDDLGVPTYEICVIAPWWAHLAALTRSLVAALPEYNFDGPGLTPFSRDHDNFWYKLARIGLTQASPTMFVSRLRWAREILNDLNAVALSTGDLDARSLLRLSNGIHLDETDGLDYLRTYFDRVFAFLRIDFSLVPALAGQHIAFFRESRARIERLKRDGTPFATDIEVFRKVFRPRSGITVSTIHGIKGAEFDTVIAFALMDGMVPHFNDADQLDGAKRLLYVIGSRARKNLHLIAERGRRRGGNWGDYTTSVPLKNLAYEYDNG
ncbi:superfamily I DNA/RNA helicase [Rathayibacter sp. PhB151]|uniref:UvrD-helicase domain-containing protein n=1 Tax=Rathayibacter sp. PhB151 TaxID=2485189 RepID=UPI00106322EA|nr:ATP-dependent helicase [Rathayibacter sp. PhB151]TDX81575.1 superfamily I DNA/RNA helicase [Rathayibacter sp. PhB151]